MPKTNIKFPNNIYCCKITKREYKFSSCVVCNLYFIILIIWWLCLKIRYLWPNWESSKILICSTKTKKHPQIPKLKNTHRWWLCTFLTIISVWQCNKTKKHPQIAAKLGFRVEANKLSIYYQIIYYIHKLVKLWNFIII